MNKLKDWDFFHHLPVDEKLPLFSKNNRLFDVIYAQQFSQSSLEKLFILADHIRDISHSKEGADFLKTLLSDKRAMLFFAQPSTRTFLSFENACHVLGMRTSEIRDTSTSSEVKGESKDDTIRTFSSYADIIIMRHIDEGFAERAAWVLNTRSKRPIPIINGGSGKDQHPTQSLLDMYTLARAFKDNGGIANKKFVMVGDLLRGRTVRSLCRLLSLYQGVEIFLVSPPEFAMKKDILTFLKEKNITVHISTDFNAVLPQVNGVYMTRIQDEHDKAGESKQIDNTPYHLTLKNLPLLQKDAVILHPFPRRNEIAPEIDQDPRACYWKQARNGMWIRAALILTLFKREDLVAQFIAKP